MSLIETPDGGGVEQVNFKMVESLKDEVKQHCKWANVKERYFFAEASGFVLKKDKAWQQIKSESDDN